MSDHIKSKEELKLLVNESIVSAVLKWAHANGRRLAKADLERMGAGVDAMVSENERLTKERDDALALLGCYKLDNDDLKARVKRLEEAGDKMADMMIWSARIIERESPSALAWRKAKEAKP